MSNRKVTSGITSFCVLVLVIKNYRNKELALRVLHKTNVIGIFVVVVLNSQQATRPHSKNISFQERQYRGERLVCSCKYYLFLDDARLSSELLHFKGCLYKGAFEKCYNVILRRLFNEFSLEQTVILNLIYLSKPAKAPFYSSEHWHWNGTSVISDLRISHLRSTH